MKNIKKICWEIRNWVGLHPVICSIGIIAIIILIPYGFFPLYNSFFPLPAKDGFSLKEHSAIVNNEYLNLVLLQYDSNNTVKRIVIPSSDKSNNAFMPDEQTIVFFKKEADKFSEWKYINGNTTQIGVVTDPNSIIPTSSNIKPNLEVKKNYNGGCNSGGGVGAPGALPIPCLSFITNKLILHGVQDWVLFTYNELSFSTSFPNRYLSLIAISSDNTMAAVQVSRDFQDSVHGKLTYAFNLETGKSALLTDNANDNIIYFR